MLTESTAQRIEDCQALSDQAGGYLPEPVSAVENGQICPRQPLGGRNLATAADRIGTLARNLGASSSAERSPVAEVVRLRRA